MKIKLSFRSFINRFYKKKEYISMENEAEEKKFEVKEKKNCPSICQN